MEEKGIKWTPDLINTLAQLLLTLFPIVVSAVQQLQQAGVLTADVQQNIKNLAEMANNSNQVLLQTAKDWEAKHSV